MMNRDHANVCSINNVIPITEKMKDNMQSFSFDEIPYFDFSESIAHLTGLRVVTAWLLCHD